MPIIVMLVTLSGSFGFVGGSPVIQGFGSIDACRNAIPTVKAFYVQVEKIECLSLHP